LLGCALGYHRDDHRLETELDARLRIGVREDRRGKIARDYHTVQPDKVLKVFPTADGVKHSPSKGGNAYSNIIQSNRYYIEDGAFLVVIAGPVELLERCRDALLHPAWPVYLGRKSCVPTRPVFECLTTDYTSIDDALERYQGSELSLPGSRAHCVVGDPDGSATRPDATVVRPQHTRTTRHVRTFVVDLPAPAITGGVP
jgi:CRISPR system Cascade subunit CasD